MRSLILTLLLLGCETETESDESTTRTEPIAHEAEEPEEVGPDGPSHLAVPDLGTPSTDAAVLARGEAVFAEKGCNACHQFGSKLVGPDLNGVTERRTVVWVERMIRHPDAMTKEDPVAKAMYRTHLVQMPNQGVSDEDLAPLVAYLVSKGGP